MHCIVGKMCLWELFETEWLLHFSVLCRHLWQIYHWQVRVLHHIVTDESQQQNWYTWSQCALGFMLQCIQWRMVSVWLTKYQNTVSFWSGSLLYLGAVPYYIKPVGQVWGYGLSMARFLKVSPICSTFLRRRIPPFVRSWRVVLGRWVAFLVGVADSAVRSEHYPPTRALCC